MVPSASQVRFSQGPYVEDRTAFYNFCERIDTVNDSFQMCSLIINELPVVFPRLTEEQLFAVFIYLFFTASALWSEEIASSLLAKAVCMITSDFLLKIEEKTDKSLFQKSSWLDGFRAVSKDKAKIGALKNYIKTRCTYQAFGGITPSVKDFFHPSLIEPRNRFHHWHAFCYWLSQFVVIGETAREVFIDFFMKLKPIEEAREFNSRVGAALSYLLQMFQKKGSSVVDVATMQVLDINSWMQFPSSNWFLSKFYISLDNKREPWVTKKIINSISSFLVDARYSREKRLSEALEGVLILGNNEGIDLVDVELYLQSIDYHLQGSYEPTELTRCDLTVDIRSLLNKIVNLAWFYNTHSIIPLLERKDFNQFSEGILQSITIVSKLIGGDELNNFLLHSKIRLINAYSRAITVLFAEISNQSSGDIRQSILKNRSVKQEMKTIYQEILRIFEGIESSPLKMQIGVAVSKLKLSFESASLKN